MKTIKQSDFEDVFYVSDDDVCHFPLCSTFSRLMVKEWEVYWKFINTEEFTTMAIYLPKGIHSELEERALLRLLIAHEFFDANGIEVSYDRSK